MGATATPNAPVATEDKTAAILSYITVIGFIAGVVIHSNKKTRLGAYHLRQSLGIIITGIAVGFGQIILAVIPIIGWIAVLCAWIGLLVIWISGLMAAVNGQMKPAPILGETYQKMLGTTFD